MNTLVIIPLFNEENNILPLFELLKEANAKKEFKVLLINDGSKDNTSNLIKELSKKNKFVFFLDHKQNRGWGDALKTGFGYAIKNNFDYVITMDGDLTHHPKYIPLFIEELQKDRADLLIGSKFSDDNWHTGVSRGRILLSKVFNLFFRLLLGGQVGDFTSGFRGYRISLLKKLRLESNSFTINIEMILKTRRMGFRIKEIPIKIYKRKYGKSSRRFLAEIPLYIKTIVKSYK